MARVYKGNPTYIDSRRSSASATCVAVGAAALVAALAVGGYFLFKYLKTGGSTSTAKTAGLVVTPPKAPPVAP